MDWVALEADQTTGGVLIIRDKRAMKKDGGYGWYLLNIGQVARGDEWFYLGMPRGLWPN